MIKSANLISHAWVRNLFGCRPPQSNFVLFDPRLQYLFQRIAISNKCFVWRTVCGVDGPCVDSIYVALLNRNALFADWYLGKEQLQEMELVQNRRLSQKQKGAIKFKPMTKKDLLVKHHDDECYVDRIIADCKKRGAYRKD